MSSVLISTQPKWCEKICNQIGERNGKPLYEKRIEVRKSRPKSDTPFKCYIHETKGKQVEHLDGCDITYYGRGKVIGEFVCDRIDELPCGVNQPYWLKEKTCITNEHYKEYLGNKNGYGWHISDLKIYDKPKELSEFRTVTNCGSIIAKDMLCNTCCICSGFCSKKPKRITRPPQSWCYVEELKNKV